MNEKEVIEIGNKFKVAAVKCFIQADEIFGFDRNYSDANNTDEISFRFTHKNELIEFILSFDGKYSAGRIPDGGVIKVRNCEYMILADSEELLSQIGDKLGLVVKSNPDSSISESMRVLKQFCEDVC